MTHARRKGLIATEKIIAKERNMGFFLVFCPFFCNFAAEKRFLQYDTDYDR